MGFNTRSVLMSSNTAIVPITDAGLDHGILHMFYQCECRDEKSERLGGFSLEDLACTRRRCWTRSDPRLGSILRFVRTIAINRVSELKYLDGNSLHPHIPLSSIATGD